MTRTNHDLKGNLHGSLIAALAPWIIDLASISLYLAVDEKSVPESEACSLQPQNPNLECNNFAKGKWLVANPKDFPISMSSFVFNPVWHKNT